MTNFRISLRRRIQDKAWEEAHRRATDGDDNDGLVPDGDCTYAMNYIMGVGVNSAGYAYGMTAVNRCSPPDSIPWAAALWRLRGDEAFK